MRIALCNLSIGNDYIQTVRYGHRSLVAYCKANNYPLFYETETLDNARGIYWQKIMMLKKRLEECDILIWIDSDIMFLKMDVKLEPIIEKYMGSKDFMLCKDVTNVNTGVWFCRNTPFVMNILNKLYEIKQFDETNMPEQLALEYLLDHNVDDIVNKSVILPLGLSCIFNPSMYNLSPPAFLVHFLGIHKREWLELVMHDHYPFHVEGEQDIYYHRRIRFLNKKYNLDIKYMKIGVCCFTVGEEYKESMKLGTISKIAYCNKHGYTFINDDTVYDKARHPAWSKILLVQKYLSQFDYIWIVDADTMIFNDSIKLEDLIVDHLGDKHILATRDVSGQINTGSMFIKNTDYNKSILNKIYDQTQFLDSITWEQEAFNFLYEGDQEMKDRCSILSTEQQTFFNCPVGLYNPNIFLIHFYGPRSTSWVNKCMRDLYPLRYDGESEESYIHRRLWHDSVYGKKSS